MQTARKMREDTSEADNVSSQVAFSRRLNHRGLGHLRDAGADIKWRKTHPWIKHPVSTFDQELIEGMVEYFKPNCPKGKGSERNHEITAEKMMHGWEVTCTLCGEGYSTD